jgi:tetratricopeptide (TPR) repeat protein
MRSYDKAIAMLNRSLELAINNKELDEQKDNYYELCKVYQSKNMLSQAIDYCKKYNSVKDSIGIADAKVRIANLEAKFENKKNILTISKMKLEQEAKKSAHILSLAGSGLIILILIIIIISYSHKRKRGTLERKLLTADNDKLEDKLKFKSKQLTSQVLMMMHKNKQLNDILKSLSVIKCSQPESKSELSKIRQQITRSIHSEEDWDLFHHYFEDVNGNFFPKLYLINNNLTPAELKLSALIKLKFSIKESASLLNISPNSVKTTRYLLRKKLGLSKGDSIYDFLGEI